MTAGFYVSPDQLMKDRAEFARKGIARGRAVVVLEYADGIAFVAENPSRSLHKISEIHDRIGFAAVGKYNEFENLRVAGIRYADYRAFAYDRADVHARGLAGAYAQTLGAVFTQESKPYEVQIAVAQLGETPDLDELYAIGFDGSVSDERHHLTMGGAADVVHEHLGVQWRPGLPLPEALELAVSALGAPSDARRPSVEHLEAAVLERGDRRRCFRRLSGSEVVDAIGE